MDVASSSPRTPRAAPARRTPRLAVAARRSTLALSAVLGVLALAPAASFALPEGRVYEKVSPDYKAGYGVTGIQDVSSNGDNVVYVSQGVFSAAPSGNPLNWYMARRGSTEWSSVPLQPPAALAPEGYFGDVSPDFESEVYLGLPGANAGISKYAADEADLLHHDPFTPDVTENWQPMGNRLKSAIEQPLVIKYDGADANFCHVIIGTPGVKYPLLTEAIGTELQLYDASIGCDGEPASLKLVGLDNKGRPIDKYCPETLGEELNAVAQNYNAISADGREIFFTANIEPAEGASSCNAKNRSAINQVFVRVAGAKTLEVSRPLSPKCVEIPCTGENGANSRASSMFRGASEDGSRVYFTAPLASGQKPLVPGDEDSSNNLYLAEIGCAGGPEQCEAVQRRVTGLREASHVPIASEAAEVQGVVKVAPNGSRVYFVARGVLTTTPGPEGHAAIKGADNLYVYDSDGGGSLAFIGQLCSGPGESGMVEDLRCPLDVTNGGAGSGKDPGESDYPLWSGERTAQTAGSDGRFLVFTSFAQLLVSDTDDAMDVYRYDAATGVLTRVSDGKAGYNGDGNCENVGGEGTKLGGEGICDAKLSKRFEVNPNARYEAYDLGDRAISEDGSRVVFESAAPLSADAINGQPDIYEWHETAGLGEGEVSLISSGTAQSGDEHAAISPEGNDIFFDTTAGLVPGDTDGQGDVYDVRVNGGFPVSPSEPLSCSSDACQGALTNPAPLLVPGSVEQAPGNEFAPLRKGEAKMKPAKRRRHKKRPKRRARGRARKGSTRRGRRRR